MIKTPGYNFTNQGLFVSPFLHLVHQVQPYYTLACSALFADVQNADDCMGGQCADEHNADDCLCVQTVRCQVLINAFFIMLCTVC